MRSGRRACAELVAQSHYTKEAIGEILSNPYVDPFLKRQALNAYKNQFQPTKIPYASGYVLISPTDPCLEQFIPN
jgi:hypothetical protein